MTMSLNLEMKITLTFVFVFVLRQASSQSASGANNQDPLTYGFLEQVGNNCGDGRFECKNGGCIDMGLVCDGRIDCSDQSDETIPLCSGPDRICQEKEFRCDYGACAPENSACNGVKDCFDNSDELLDQCPRPLRHASVLVRLFDIRSNPYVSGLRDRLAASTSLGGKAPTDSQILTPSTTSSTSLTPRPTTETTPRPTTTTTTTTTTPRPSTTTTTTTTTTTSNPFADVFCLTPPQPENGRWEYRPAEDGAKMGGISRPGEGVQAEFLSTLLYTCDSGYELESASLRDRICELNGEWSDSPICVPIVVTEGSVTEPGTGILNDFIK